MPVSSAAALAAVSVAAVSVAAVSVAAAMTQATILGMLVLHDGTGCVDSRGIGGIGGHDRKGGANIIEICYETQRFVDFLQWPCWPTLEPTATSILSMDLKTSPAVQATRVQSVSPLSSQWSPRDKNMRL